MRQYVPGSSKGQLRGIPKQLLLPSRVKICVAMQYLIRLTFFFLNLILLTKI